MKQFWAAPAGGRSAHSVQLPDRRKNIVEGDLTNCGRSVPTHWLQIDLTGPLGVCRQCAANKS